MNKEYRIKQFSENQFCVQEKQITRYPPWFARSSFTEWVDPDTHIQTHTTSLLEAREVIEKLKEYPKYYY